MYLTDIALNKLKTYRGSSPIPADFDAFWDEGVREMKALDADVQLIPCRASNAAICTSPAWAAPGSTQSWPGRWRQRGKSPRF